MRTAGDLVSRKTCSCVSEDNEERSEIYLQGRDMTDPMGHPDRLQWEESWGPGPHNVKMCNVHHL